MQLIIGFHGYGIPGDEKEPEVIRDETAKVLRSLRQWKGRISQNCPAQDVRRIEGSPWLDILAGKMLPRIPI